MAKTPKTDEEIREAAYHMWREAGEPAGQDQEYWYRAQAELGDAPAKKKAARKPATKPAAKPAAKATTARKPAAKKPAAKKPAAKAKATKA